MPFSDVRNNMRENQKALCEAQHFNAEKDCEQIDVISSKNAHKISQIKLNHLNKVASTASPLLSKTPNRVTIRYVTLSMKFNNVLINI